MRRFPLWCIAAFRDNGKYHRPSLDDGGSKKMINGMLDVWPSFTRSPWTPQFAKELFAPTVSSERGEFVSKRFDADEGSLQYKLFIPGGRAGPSMPLIVMLHGGGQDADDFALETGMNQLAEQHKCFVLYPQQSAGANWSMCWNWFDDTHHHRGQGEPALIAALTRKVIAEHPIERNRIFVAGLSAGGAMAIILGRTYPDLFAAVGSHSGLAYGSATDCYGAIQAMKEGIDARDLPSQPAGVSVPVIVFHGDSDFTVHPRNSTSIVQQFRDSYEAQAWHAPVSVSVSKETGEAGGRAFTRQVHKGKAGQVVAEHWTINGSGHAWSGGARRGRYTDVEGPDASKEMLRFFLQPQRREANP
jgi:poly(hydroxyalkanoate) depolymerase family esterase